MTSKSVYYRLLTKLLEGNVFSPVCLSVCLFRGKGSLYRAWALNHPAKGPSLHPFFTGCSHTLSEWSPSLNPSLLNLDLTVQLLPLDMFKLVHYAAQTVHKWVVKFRLKCFFYCPQMNFGGKVMFSHLSVILFERGCLPHCMLGYTPTLATHSPGRQSLGRHPWANAPLGRHPKADTPPPIGRHLHRYYGIWSTSGRYASY